jgi:hypothetical protein
MSYKGIVSKITVFPHPNADRLQCASAKGYNFIVGLEAKTDDLYVIFPDDGILSREYCVANDLYPIKDEYGNRIGGGYFIEGKERVKAQNFRKVKSECFGMPVSSLGFTGYDVSNLKDGDMIDTLNKVKICEKYYTPATLRAMKNGTLPKAKKIELNFPQHTETTQWRFANPQAGTLIHFTEKLHGTSVRVTNTKVRRPLTWWQKVQRFFNKNKDFAKAEYVLGTRRTVLLTDKNGDHVGGYYTDKTSKAYPYTLALEELQGKLPEDVQVYGEIVGYLPSGKCLFTHNTEEDKESVKRYGPVIDYSYSNPVGQAAFYVYRVTDKGRDLSWFEMVAFCKARNLKLVPHLGTFYYEGNKEHLDKQIAFLEEGSSTLDERHIREGICVLLENENGSKIYKAKSFTFRLFEGLVKNDANYVDLEEIS